MNPYHLEPSEDSVGGSCHAVGPCSLVLGYLIQGGRSHVWIPGSDLQIDIAPYISATAFRGVFGFLVIRVCPSPFQVVFQ